MNGWDIVIIVLIVLLVVAAVLVMRRRGKTGCSCGCEGCSRSCGKNRDEKHKPGTA